MNYEIKITIFWEIGNNDTAAVLQPNFVECTIHLASCYDLVCIIPFYPLRYHESGDLLSYLIATEIYSTHIL